MEYKAKLALPHDQAEKRAKELLQQLTREEKLKLIGGTKGFYIEEVPRLGIKEVFMSDASQGVNIRDEWQGEKCAFTLEKSTAYPCMLQLASTWNTPLAAEYAHGVAEECLAGGTHILLGPGMNIYRHSQCGRNFEYLGEDPHLVSRMIENYVSAMQSTGVSATLKHFIANNTDYYRRKSNSIVDERSLHEIYLPAFKAGIEAGATAVMTSYNLVNGQWCSQSDKIIKDLLRGELGFQWLVMSDWWAVDDGETTIKSGLNLEMPAREVMANAEELLDLGKVSMEDIDAMVLYILKTCIAMDFYNPDFKRPELLSKLPEHEQIALQTAREGIVMLENRNDLLPLAKGKRILITGKYVTENVKGGGAASCEGYNHSTLLEQLKAIYGDSITHVTEPSEAQLAEADVVILSVGTFDSEGCDHSFNLPDEQERLAQRCVELNSNTLVVVNSGHGLSMTTWAPKAGAILYGWYGGQTGSRALAEVISGQVNPSGKLPITIERRFEDSPGYGYIPQGEELYSGWRNEEEAAREVYDLPYKEGILVGYRWYEARNIVPLYPFGYGKSYSEFRYSNLELEQQTMGTDDSLTIHFHIENTSSADGLETAQVYVEEINPKVQRPPKELKGFTKVPLAQGQEKKISLTLDKSSFSYWDESRKHWHVEPGKFRIHVGSSSRDIHLSGEIEIV